MYKLIFFEIGTTLDTSIKAHRILQTTGYSSLLFCLRNIKKAEDTVASTEKEIEENGEAITKLEVMSFNQRT